MSLAKKLNLKEGMTVRTVDAPKDIDLGDVPLSKSPSTEAILVFVADTKALAKHEGALIEVARRDGLAWIAYPKGGQLGTDLNRDIVWQLLQDKGIRPVRQVSLDEVWSALRFRPAEKK